MSLIEFIESVKYEKTDKYNLGYVHHFYNELFTPIRNSVENILEIGIYKGHSLRLWHDYFENARIVGIDIKIVPALENFHRIEQIQSDAYNLETLKKFKPSSFDIVIDDGPHTFESLDFFLKNYIKLVKPGGILVVEDIIDTNWTHLLVKNIENMEYYVKHLGGLGRTERLKKKWSKGLDIIIVVV